MNASTRDSESSSSIAVISSEAPEKFKDWLRQLGHELFLMEPAPGPDPRLACHPDLQMAQIDHDLFIASPWLMEQFQSSSGKKKPATGSFLTGTSQPLAPYPGDCSYNVLRVGDLLFTGPEPEPEILSAAQNLGLEIIIVKQGYVRCSALPLGRGLITADPSIAKAAEKHNVPLLLIPQGLARLRGFDYGFIGGCFGLDWNNHAALACGGRDSLPLEWAQAIQDFAREMGWVVQWCAGVDLEDIGSAFFLSGPA